VKKRRILRSERGFTLVELGIVMAIIAILAAVAYPTYDGMRKKAHEAEAKAAMQEIRVEAWSWYVEEEAWPTQIQLGLGEDGKKVGKWTITAYEITTPTDAKGTYSTGFTADFEIKAEIKATGGTVTDTIYLGLDEDGKAEFGK